MRWHKFPEYVPPVDDERESTYLLVACNRAVPPLTGYYDGVSGEFYPLGCPGASKLEGVRAWAKYPKLPAELFDDPLLLRHAKQGGLIEGEPHVD